MKYMNLTKKEEYLISKGKKIETINFCKKNGVKSDNIVWFVEKIEKENFDINKKDSDIEIDLLLRLFDYNKKIKELSLDFFSLIEMAKKNFETKKSVEERVLHIFKNGHYIIFLTPKELEIESVLMSNCVSDYFLEIKNKTTSILALKNKQNKTICHFEVNKNGSLNQMFEKSNREVSLENIKYICNFFDLYKDVNLYNEIFSKNIKPVFKINEYEEINKINIINYSIPLTKTIDIFKNNEHIESSKYLYNLSNSNIFNIPNKNYFNIEEVEENLKKLKTFYNNSIDEMIEKAKIINENLFILSDSILEKIFGKINNKNNKLDYYLGLNEEKHKLNAAPVEMCAGEEPLEKMSQEFNYNYESTSVRNNYIKESSY